MDFIFSEVELIHLYCITVHVTT